MFDISLTEMLLVAVIGLLVIGPDDFPVIMRAIGKAIGRIKESAREFIQMFEQAAEIDDIKSVSRDIEEGTKQNIEMIVDLEGGLRHTYDISNFMRDKEVKKEGGGGAADV